MMYNQKLVASIKANGKILREFKDTVYIPFGCEYSILLKNLSTVRCIVNVWIDSNDIIPGGLVISPGQDVDLERSIVNGNLSQGNKFKFIERTSAIENGPRGIKLEDGLIRVEYQFEKVYPRVIPTSYNWAPKEIPQQNWYGPFYSSVGASGSAGDRFSVSASGSINQLNIGGALRGVDTSLNGASMQASAASAINDYCAKNGIGETEYHDGAATMDWNDVGITVPGSKSEQKFATASWFPTETEKHSIVLKLLGETPDNKPVMKLVTSKHKPKCVTCGKLNKHNAKFCAECGTALEIFA